MPILQFHNRPAHRGLDEMRVYCVGSCNGGKMTLEEWLEQTQERRTELDAYARSPLPIGNDSAGEINTLIAAEDNAQRLLADAQTYLTQAMAQAVLRIKREFDENSADERRILVKDAVRDIQRLVDGIAVTARAMSNRRYLHMNQNRSR